MSRNLDTTDPGQLLDAGASTCARAVNEGRVSAAALCETAIGRIEARDGAINAVVLRDFGRAREQAKGVDAARSRGERLPLAGVPMTVKESFNMAGLPTSWGLPPFRDFMPERDATAVERLKAAGAVILGKSNVPTALADWQSANAIHGRTVNPHDPARTPGGSSGGGAAALAAGMVALELGSDLYGSIRVPAHFCGVYGHKPSVGVLPSRGQDFPGTDLEPGDRPGVIGPLARCAEDLDLALDVLAGPEMPDAAAWQLQLVAPRHARLRDFRVLVLAEHPAAECATEMRQALDNVAARLQDAGAAVARKSDLLPDLQSLSKDYGTLVNTVLSVAQPGGSTTLSAHDWIRLMGRRDALRVQWRAFFDEFDALLCPPFGCAAFAHQDAADWNERSLKIDGRDTRFGAQGAWSTMASHAGLPATVAPLTKDAAGLPLGVQIIGPYLEDRTTVALARLLATA
ncbi:amidase family protein [Variovorax dokdonensis]|uniref:Amidase family protein n=1 Tax=Variovorax dokdonensis TaxID=344883 RepID=A0ABT7N9G7_9BURK|nr:amidase family protein [Variovorax dokdonensis]MDM0044588.1 amidase family protein [Variovorax dokdonensis]